MAATVSIKELRKMQKEDLLREVAQQKILVAKIKMSIQMKGEKDTSKLAKARMTLAHMQTVVSEKNWEELRSEAEKSKVSSPEKSS